MSTSPITLEYLNLKQWSEPTKMTKSMSRRYCVYSVAMCCISIIIIMYYYYYITSSAMCFIIIHHSCSNVLYYITSQPQQCAVCTVLGRLERASVTTTNSMLAALCSTYATRVATDPFTISYHHTDLVLANIMPD